MTPKEKAKELVELYRDENYTLTSDMIENSKHNALIVAAQMIKEVDSYREFGTWESRLKYREIFWQEVITEIEKL